MDKRSKIRKAVIVSLAVISAIIISPFVYTEYRLISGEHTRMQDIDEAIRVNHGSDYEALRMITYNNRTEQIVMAKYDHIFLDYLVNELGCREYDRMGALGFYETKGGKKFDLIMEDRSSGTITHIPYAVEKIGGITMDEIVADSNIN